MRCTALLIILSVVPAVLGIDICPTREITSSSGQITSPNYPNKYSPNTDCTLTIKRPLDTKFLFNFTYIDLGGNVYSWYCGDDTITITGRREKKFCGAKINSSYEFNLNVVTLRFKSNNRRERTGFKLIYTTIINKAASGRQLPVPTSVCPSRTIQADEAGRIMSPGYPLGNYGKTVDCELKLKVPFYKKLDLVTEHMDIAGGFCGTESLSLHEFGSFHMTCGKDVDPKRTRQGYFNRGDVSIFYRSDGTVHSKGLMLSYRLVDKYPFHCSNGNGKLYLKRAINMADLFKRQNGEIRLRFRTGRTNGLLVYINGGPNAYLLLKLQKGRIVFECDFGTGNITLTSQMANLNDQKWYQVALERRGRYVNLAVDRYPPVFDPKVCRDMHFCADYPDFRCFSNRPFADECRIKCGRCSVPTIRPGTVQLPSNITQLLNKSQSGLNATMYVFGAPSSAQFPVKNFKGWLQDVVINDLHPVASYVTKDTSYTLHGSKKIKTTECYND